MTAHPAPPPAAPARPAPAPAPPRDWHRVTRARYTVRQLYRYAYTAPVTDLRQRLVMLPPDRYGDQRLLAHAVVTSGAEGLVERWEADRFGNRVGRLTAAAVRDAVEFAAEFTVERHGPPTPLPLPAATPLAPYLAPTALTAPGGAISAAAQALAAEVDADPDGQATFAAHRPRGGVLPHGVGVLPLADRRPWALAWRAFAWTARAIRYQHGVTGVQTPAGMALHLGAGVCQDYAHIAIALLRALGVPARYVSGHLLGEGAPHAWLEALLPDPAAPGRLCAVANDPTHTAAPGLNYITVAVGRDYADVAPTSGAFSGSAAGRLSAHKDAWVVELADDGAAA